LLLRENTRFFVTRKFITLLTKSTKLKPVHELTHDFSEIQLNVMFQYTSTSPKSSHRFGFSNYSVIRNFRILRARHRDCGFSFSLFSQCNDIR
jgi:hypothetical protein